MTNSKATDRYTLIKSLRALYRNSFDKSINDIQRTYENIIKICEQHEIEIDFVTMSDLEYNDHLINFQLAQLNQINNNY